MDQSLDDIIKRKRVNKPNIRGKARGGGGAVSRGNLRKNIAPARGGIVSRRGRGNMNTMSRSMVQDARMKIIQNKREHLVDARDQLVQLAKHVDARDKLNLLRIKRGPKHTSPTKQYDARSKLQSRRGGRIGPSGQVNRQFHMVKGGLGRQLPGIGLDAFNKKIPRYMEEDEEELAAYDYLDELAAHAMLPHRTVHNNPLTRLSRLSEPDRNFGASRILEPSRSFGVGQGLEVSRNRVNLHSNARAPVRGVGTQSFRAPQSSPFALTALRVKVSIPERGFDDNLYCEDEDMMELDEEPPRSILPLSSYKNVKPPRPTYQLSSQSSGMVSQSQEWLDLEEMRRNSRSEIKVETAGRMSTQLRSRLDISSRTSSAPAPQPGGFKVLVTNLQASVTEDDIKELFGDIGPLSHGRLLRPGTAEVVYKQRSHALSAVDVYHKRQLDGQPMNVVMLASSSAPMSKFASANPIPTSSKLGLSSSNSKTIQPDISTIHRALFKSM